MANNYICIDGGTTNTRLHLWQDGTVTDVYRIRAGAQSGIEDREGLVLAVRDGIAALLARNALQESDICRVLASGMITCEHGLYLVPHIAAPAGIEELSRGLCEVQLPQVCGIPFVFVPGVALRGDTPEESDVMRGEETELVGLGLAAGEGALYILPGSHSKLIRTDAAGRIVDFSTMLSGEMAAALSQHTILRDAVDLATQGCDAVWLRRGYDCACKQGVNAALFKVRVLKNLFGGDALMRYSFFMGAVLCDEVRRICEAPERVVILGGQSQLKAVMAMLLQQVCQKEIRCIEDAVAADSAVRGMVRMMQYRNR